MRESTSVWLYEDNGAFSLPRFGIEAEASSWENPQYQVNFAFPGGAYQQQGPRQRSHRPSVLTAARPSWAPGPLSFRCIEPFRQWVTTFDGMAIDGTVDEQIAGRLIPTACSGPLRAS